MQMCAIWMRPWCMYQWCSYPWYMYMYMFSTRKRCLIGILIWGYQNFYSLPPKNWILGPKTAKFGPKLAFWAKYRHFWPIWSNAWPKNNADKLPKWFSVMLVPKLLLTPIKIRIFGQKRPYLAKNSNFSLFLLSDSGQLSETFPATVQLASKTMNDAYWQLWRLLTLQWKQSCTAVD